MTIDVVSWDDPDAPAPMLANLSPQDAVNRGLPTPAMCDLTVVIVWGRLGTPLAEPRKKDGTPYRSGTEWEFENALEAGKDVLLYRRTSDVQVRIDDPELEVKREQKRLVDDFFLQLKGADGSRPDRPSLIHNQANTGASASTKNGGTDWYQLTGCTPELNQLPKSVRFV